MLITWSCPLCHCSHSHILDEGENRVACRTYGCNYVWYLKVMTYEKEKFELPSPA